MVELYCISVVLCIFLFFIALILDITAGVKPYMTGVLLVFVISFIPILNLLWIWSGVRSLSRINKAHVNG